MLLQMLLQLKTKCWSVMSQCPLPFKHLHTACTCWNDWLPDTLSLSLVIVGKHLALSYMGTYMVGLERVTDIRLAWITGTYIICMAILYCTASRAVHYFTTVNRWISAILSYCWLIQFQITGRLLMIGICLPLPIHSCLYYSFAKHGKRS